MLLFGEYHTSAFSSKCLHFWIEKLLLENTTWENDFIFFSFFNKKTNEKLNSRILLRVKLWEIAIMLTWQIFATFGEQFCPKFVFERFL